MKKYIFISSVALFFCCQLTGQKIRDLKWWKQNTSSLDSFPAHLALLSDFINELNSNTIIPLKKSFDNCDSKGDREVLFRRIRDSDTPAIRKNSQNIKKSNFYKDKNNKIDSLFLYYYTNKELNDYLSSLDALQAESMKLIDSPRFSTSSFDRLNFLNAYYNVTLSRSLLLAAMNNLERYFLLGSVADSIQLNVVRIDSGLLAVSTNFDTALKNIKSQVNHTDTLLNNSFKTYKPLRNQKYMAKVSPDKISMAANSILIDQRKNWWWRTLIGGIVGGIITGFVILAFK